MGVLVAAQTVVVVLAHVFPLLVPSRANDTVGVLLGQLPCSFSSPDLRRALDIDLFPLFLSRASWLCPALLEFRRKLLDVDFIARSFGFGNEEARLVFVPVRFSFLCGEQELVDVRCVWLFLETGVQVVGVVDLWLLRQVWPTTVVRVWVRSSRGSGS